MDEVALFNRALSANEVKQLHSMAGGGAGPLFDSSSRIDRGTQGSARFAGVWTGLAVDKPEDGTSRDRLMLELNVDEFGHLAGIAAGEFVNDGYCRLRNIELSGKQISFEIRHRFQNMRMGIRLQLQGDKLEGEGLPIEDDDDRCDIVLQRESRVRPRVDRPEPRRSGPILHYPFNNTGGPHVTDESGHGHHAMMHGTRYEENGKVGNAMSFSGDGAYISTPNITLRDFTFAAWVKTHTDRLNNRRLLLLSDGARCYALQANVGSGLGVYVADDVEVNEYDWSFRQGQWTHVAVTHDGSIFKIYRDGRPTETGTIKTDGVTGTLHIGGTDRHRGGFWQGMIDELFIFNRALSDAEIEQLYGKAKGTTQVFQSGRTGRPRIHTSAFRSTSQFKGVWSGMAVDKPEDGGTRNKLTLELTVDESGRLRGTASGSFVRDESAELKNLKIADNQISFEVAHRIADLRMAVTLERIDNTLKGEALPIDFEEDSCDILLKRRQLR